MIVYVLRPRGSVSRPYSDYSVHGHKVSMRNMERMSISQANRYRRGDGGTGYGIIKAETSSREVGCSVGRLVFLIILIMKVNLSHLVHGWTQANVSASTVLAVCLFVCLFSFCSFVSVFETVGHAGLGRATVRHFYIRMGHMAKIRINGLVTWVDITFCYRSPAFLR